MELGDQVGRRIGSELLMSLCGYGKIIGCPPCLQATVCSWPSMVGLSMLHNGRWFQRECMGWEMFNGFGCRKAQGSGNGGNENRDTYRESIDLVTPSDEAAEL